jgi:hypothetical protein
MAEDGLISGETTPGRTTGQIEARRREIEADPDFLNKFKNPAKNAALVKEWNTLYDELHPEPIQGSR